MLLYSIGENIAVSNRTKRQPSCYCVGSAAILVGQTSENSCYVVGSSISHYTPD